MTEIKEVNRHTIYIILRHCYFVEYVELLPRGVKIIFSGKLTRNKCEMFKLAFLLKIVLREIYDTTGVHHPHRTTSKSSSFLMNGRLPQVLNQNTSCYTTMDQKVTAASLLSPPMMPFRGYLQQILSSWMVTSQSHYLNSAKSTLSKMCI